MLFLSSGRSSSCCDAILYRQHRRLSICSYFGWVWQILRRLWRPPESGCGIFEEPQLSENWLQLTVFDGLALPHISINVWICFWCILFIFQQLRRTFLPAFLYFQLLKFGGTLLLVCTITQIWGSSPIGRHKSNQPIGTFPWIWALRELLRFGELKDDTSRWRLLQLCKSDLSKN